MAETREETEEERTIIETRDFVSDGTIFNLDGDY